MNARNIPSPAGILDSYPPSVRGKHLPPPQRSEQKQITPSSHKPKQTKSRNGCITCKAKRLKCDETKPGCRQCHRRKISCGGYKKAFKWRPFEETAVAVGRPTATSLKKANGPSPSSKTDPHQVAFPTPPTTYQSTSPTASQSISSNLSPPDSTMHSSPRSVKSFLSADARPVDDCAFAGDEGSTGDESTSVGCLSIPVDSDPSEFSSFSDPFQFSMPLSDDWTASQDFIDWRSVYLGLEEFSAFPVTSMDESSFSRLLSGDNEDIEEIIPQSAPGPRPLHSPAREDQSLGWSQISQEPSLASGSEEMLIMRFDKVTCGILSIKDGMMENPWRSVVWPLAKSTPALQSAILALSAFHAAKENPSLRVQGVKHMRQSIVSLRQNIQNMPADTALATTLALAFADTWDQNTRTCIQHLRGAKALMLQVLTVGLQGGLRQEELDRIRFLHNTWTYMDVLSRLTSLDDSGPQDLNPSIFQLPADAVHEIDPLMGCAATLFPLIGKVGSLVQRVRRTTTNSVSIVSQAMEMKAMIEQWQPPRWFEPPEDPSSEVQHSIQMAHAYRWATLLYLHQAVPELPSEPAEDLAKRVLILLATVPPSSRTTIIQMYPLLAAGAEVDSEDDRKWVLERWAVVQSRLMIGGVDRCLDVIREVWARRDRARALRREEQQVEVSASRRASSFSSESMGKLTASLRASSNDTRALHVGINSSDHSGKSVRRQSLSTICQSGESQRVSALSSLENIEFERTIRSRSHWVSIMGEWGWEVFLG